MITERDQTVDWAAVVRRSRRTRWLAVAVAPAWVWAVSYVNLGDREGELWVWFVGASALGVAAIVFTVLRSRRGGPSYDDGARAAHALRHHVDPGGEARLLADRQARQAMGLRWATVFLPLLGLGQASRALGDGRPPDAPTVVAAVVVAAGFAALGLLAWRSASDGRRWLADPPGPAREPAPATPWERRVTSRWLTGVLVVGVAATIAGAVLGLVTR